ncbi:putative outer membrane protein [Leptolyngbya sp. NIES-3755]|nr:putative outer membrane protein [Leptolyngbya sp. NIES-3755]
MKWLALAIAVSLAACRPIESPPTTTLSQPSTPAVTRLEPPTTIEPTRLESSSSAPTSTTTITVQQAITDLQAQRTSEGLQVNLPENILFDFDKADIRPNAKPTLQKLSVLLKTYQNSPTEIRGYTDSKGSDEYNQDLSERRAKAVESYLVQNFQVNGDRLTPKGLGKTQPIAPNTKPDGSDDPEGRQKNRRVEVIIRNIAP